ncbi:MAG: PilX N-terminal domain-containing pilus assembly protein [Acidobacteriota bacterium]
MRTRRSERGAALVVAILVLAILTVIGIALMLITSTESRIAANEWSVNRGFYAADAGVRWSSVEMNNTQSFLTRNEFKKADSTSNPFGYVLFNMEGHQFRQGSLLPGSFLQNQNDIDVKVSTPGRLGRRPYRGGIINEQGSRAQYLYAFELRSRGADDRFLKYSKSLVADVEVGPLPARLPF